MASAEHEPITGVWGQSPWSEGRRPPEAESILVIGCPTEPTNLVLFQKCICISSRYITLRRQAGRRRRSVLCTD